MKSEQQLLEEMPKKGYPPHPIANVFPMMITGLIDQLGEDIQENGQRVKIVLLDGMVLDGRNTQEAMLERKLPPRFREFDPKKDGPSPAKFAMSMNLPRRHLTPSQAAMVAVDMLQFFEAEALQRQRESGGVAVGVNLPTPPPNGETTVDTSGDFAQVPQRKAGSGAGKGRSTKRAASIVGVSTTSVKKAKGLAASDPAKAEEVRMGAKSLNKALSEPPTKGSQAAEEYEAALARIETICGKQLAKGIREGAILRQRKDVLTYAEQTDEKMLATRTLIAQSWTLKRALLFKAEDIVPTHRIIDLANRTMATKEGRYTQDVLIENAGVVARITCEIIAGDVVRAAKKKKKNAPKKKSSRKK